MLPRTRTVGSRCLFKWSSVSRIQYHAGRASSTGSGLASLQTANRSSGLPLSNICILHRKHSHLPTYAQCRTISGSAIAFIPKEKNSTEATATKRSSPSSQKKRNIETVTTNTANIQLSSSIPTAIVDIPDYKHLKTLPDQDLDNLQFVIDRLLATNAKTSKLEILAQHPEQVCLMAWVYDPYRQFYVRPSRIIKYAQHWAQQQDDALAAAKTATATARESSYSLDSEKVAIRSGTRSSSGKGHVINEMATNQAVITESKFDTLPSLLEALSSRSIVGHAALDAIISFLDRFCWSNSQSLFQTINASSPAGSYGKTMATLLSTPRSKLLLKIFDKNLKAGCSVGMIREVSPSLLPGFHVALGHHMPLEKAKTLFDNALSVPESTMESKRKKSSKNASPKIVDKEWFASRKLDGVRCLVRIDRQSGNITAISRNGRPFEGMGMIQESIRSILRMGQSDVVQNRDKFFRQALGLHNATDTLPDTLILDGEMCVFETESQETVSGSPLPVIVGQVENDNLGREKFTKAITYVTRGTVDDRLLGTLEDDDEFDNSISNKQLMEELTITKSSLTEETDISGYDRPLYCIFDCLTDREFNERKGSRPLIDRIQAITNALIEANDSQSSDNIVKVMSQTKVSSYKQLEKIVAQGIERGWEGVILRKNVGYEGKRSRNLLKFKEFHDAEFKVVEAILGSMRIAVQGKYEERKVLTSVVVMHRGNRVKVGSGFSAEERVRFGRDPSLIVGKTITVKYFEESKTYLNSGIGNGNDSNGDGATVLSIDPMSERESANGSTGKNSDAAGDETKAVWSLRFPIVKAIYDEGPRQI